MNAAQLPPPRIGPDSELCYPQYLQSRGKPLREYYAFVPPGSETMAPLVLVHGISRNAAEMIMRFSAEFERYKVPLIAPLFRKESYGMYQQLLDRRSSARADEALFDIVDDVAARWGTNSRRFHLFGFSGGAQFAHRFAFLHPRRLLSCMPASAGWYSWPDEQLQWPLGVSGAPAGQLDRAALKQMPMHVLVGDRDIRSDEALRRDPMIDAIQGVSRLKRAERFCAALHDSSWNQKCTLTVLQGVGHSFASACQAGLVQHVLKLIRTSEDISGDCNEICAPGDNCSDSCVFTGAG